MIEMGVGDEDFFQRESMRLDHLQDALEITTRIDDGSSSGFLAPNDRAVLLKCRYRHNFDFHARALYTVIAKPR